MKAPAFVLAAFCWLTNPTLAAAESWILWESVEERRLHPVDSPFPSQAACVSRGQARIAQYRQQDRFKKPGVVSEATDGGLTLSARWKETTDHTASAKDLRAATTAYRKALERLVTFHEAALSRALQQLDQRRDLHNRGSIGPDEVDQAETVAKNAQQKLDETRREIAVADQQLTKPIPPPTTSWVGFTALRYQCWPVGVNPQ